MVMKQEEHRSQQSLHAEPKSPTHDRCTTSARRPPIAGDESVAGTSRGAATPAKRCRKAPESGNRHPADPGNPEHQSPPTATAGAPDSNGLGHRSGTPAVVAPRPNWRRVVDPRESIAAASPGGDLPRQLETGAPAPESGTSPEGIPPAPMMVPASSHHHATIDGQHLTGDVTPTGTGQVQRRFGDV